MFLGSKLIFKMVQKKRDTILQKNALSIKKVAKHIESKEKTLKKIFLRMKELFSQLKNQIPDPKLFVQQIIQKIGLGDSYEIDACQIINQMNTIEKN